jgi:heterotetrameric sarcosine oxidase gamma subunit
VTEVTVQTLGRAPLHQLELWSDPRPTAQRLAKVLGHELPRAGMAHGALLRTGPTTWLISGDTAALAEPLGNGGALTPVGGGLVRVRLSGPGWRSLLMEGGLFDAQSPAFGVDCVATTLIEHVTVTLRVESEDACLAYVPSSHAQDLVHFWNDLLSADALPR